MKNFQASIKYLEPVMGYTGVIMAENEEEARQAVVAMGEKLTEMANGYTFQILEIVELPEYQEPLMLEDTDTDDEEDNDNVIPFINPNKLN